MSETVSKERLLTWVDELEDLDLPVRWVLEKLARFADAQRFTWAAVPYLVKVSGLSERKVRYILQELQTRGLIEKTERTHRLEGTTRSVPVYRVDPAGDCLPSRAKSEVLLARSEVPSMGAPGAPMPEYGCTEEGGMGAQGVHPYKDRKELKEEADASSTGERARAGGPDGCDEVEVGRLVEALWGAYPRRARAWSDPGQVRDAVARLIAAGVDAGKLVQAAAAFAADPAVKRRDFGPPKLETWLTRESYLGHWPDDAAAAPEAPAPGEIVPDEVRAALGAGAVNGARWSADSRRLVTASNLMARRLRETRAAEIVRLQITVLGPSEASQAQEVA